MNRPTQKELAAAFGLSDRYIRDLIARGMPREIEPARAWYSENVMPHARDGVGPTEDELINGYTFGGALQCALLDLLPKWLTAGQMKTLYRTIEKELREGGMSAAQAADEVDLLRGCFAEAVAEREEKKEP